MCLYLHWLDSAHGRYNVSVCYKLNFKFVKICFMFLFLQTCGINFLRNAIFSSSQMYAISPNWGCFLVYFLSIFYPIFLSCRFDNYCAPFSFSIYTFLFRFSLGAFLCIRKFAWWFQITYSECNGKEMKIAGEN